MGNYCHSEETPKSEKPTLRESIKGKLVFQNLISINTQFLEQCKDSYFIQFHKNIVQKDIESLSKFMNQKMLNASIKGSYPTEEEKQIISKNISKDIQQREKHLYNQLIFHYNQFLNELFELDQNFQLNKKSNYNAGDVRVNAQLIRNTFIKRSLSDNHRFQEQLISDENISYIDQNVGRQFQENKQLANLFLDQLSCIFKLCYSILEYVYSNFILSIFGTTIDSFTDRYLLISKIYQKNIIEQNPDIQQLITFAIQIKYENKSSLIKSEHMSPAILQPQLIPQTIDSILSRESEIQLLDSIEKNLKNQQQDQKVQSSEQNLYYSQTFSTIDKIINSKMPWLKFQLIGKLDQQIVDIFLQCRSQSQIAHFIDVIKPEDSKVEVLLYILQRYMSSRKNQNLSLCYYELRWMQEDDNILHKKVKTITCPYFSRFLSLYEISFKNYQRKQAQLQYN